MKYYGLAILNVIIFVLITPTLVNYRALEKWDGILPRITGSAAIPFVNVDGEAKK